MRFTKAQQKLEGMLQYKTQSDPGNNVSFDNCMHYLYQRLGSTSQRTDIPDGFMDNHDRFYNHISQLYRWSRKSPATPNNAKDPNEKLWVKYGKRKRNEVLATYGGLAVTFTSAAAMAGAVIAQNYVGNTDFLRDFSTLLFDITTGAAAIMTLGLISNTITENKYVSKYANLAYPPNLAEFIAEGSRIAAWEINPYCAVLKNYSITHKMLTAQVRRELPVNNKEVQKVLANLDDEAAQLKQFSKSYKKVCRSLSRRITGPSHNFITRRIMNIVRENFFKNQRNMQANIGQQNTGFGNMISDLSKHPGLKAENKLIMPPKDAEYKPDWSGSDGWLNPDDR